MRRFFMGLFCWIDGAKVITANSQLFCWIDVMKNYRRFADFSWDCFAGLTV